MTTSQRPSSRYIQQTSRRSDVGSVLPLVLVIVVVLGVLVIATATYATTTLRYGQVAESKSDRLSAAEGGMRDVLDRIENGQLPICATDAGSGAGVTITNIPDISGASVEVTCQQVGGTLSDITGWAMIVTGEGPVPDDEGLTTQEANEKIFGGPTYIRDLDLLGLNQDLKIEQGDLFYYDSSCSQTGDFVAPTYEDDDPGDGGDVLFDSAIRGLWCTDLPWTALYTPPAPPALPTGAPAGFEDIGGCRVFYPGRYTTAPLWDDNNYMFSGDYLFDIGGSGLVTISGSTVTAGREGAGGDQQEIDNAPCDPVRDSDTGQGATFYLDGDSHFEVESNGSLEILRRPQGDTYVSVQTLPSHDLDFTTAVLTTESGNNKQMAIHGLVWAPYAGLVLGNVTNATVAQILGGAVVARVQVNASASATGLIIRVQGAPSSDVWALTSVATKDDGTTIVKVIAEVRFSSTDAGQSVWEVAVNSWRVCEGNVC